MTADVDAAAATVEDVRTAAARLTGITHVTPVVTSRGLDEQVGARVVLKAECLQRTGSFKLRGAANAVASIPTAQRPRGVVAFSSGNHAQAVALAARVHGVGATIVMPIDTPDTKLAATRGYGAEVVTYDRYREDREQLARDLAADRGASLIPPYDHAAVIAGQGTAALELLDQAPRLDQLLVPVGGGGLIAGCLTVTAALSPATRVVGVEPDGRTAARESLRRGQRVEQAVPRTLADGQQTRSVGRLPFEVMRRHLDEVVGVGDDAILAAMRLLFERLKLVVEPSGASALAALLSGAVTAADQTVGVVLSGGNIGVTRFGQLLSDTA